MSDNIERRKQVDRSPNGSRFLLRCFENAWYYCFFTHPDFAGKDDVPASEAKKIWRDVENNLASFLGTGSPCEADKVKRYCKGSKNLEEIEHGVGEAGTKLAAWIDDRNSSDLTGHGMVRSKGTFLTVTGLLRYLREPRYRHDTEPDAERRLVHISDLTPEMILALAVTAPYQQIPALRDAICKHVTFRSSIRVDVSSNGLPSFQMEFHLPFFALRKATASKFSLTKTRGKQLRDCEQLTLLTPDATGEDGQANYFLHKAQISCVIHGFNEWQYVAYAFEDTQHGPRDEDDEEVIDRELDPEEVTFGEEEEDPISGRLATEEPIWRPRQFFLKAFETQIRKYGDEWDELVHRLEDDRTEYIRLHPVTSSNQSQNSKASADEMNASFNWTKGRMSLLRKLHGVLSATIREWNIFISSDGDLGYFSDLDELPSNSAGFYNPRNAACQSLRNVNHAFKELENNRQRLVSLNDELASDLSTLKLSLSLVGNAATENSAFLSKFSIWVLCPCSLTATFFSMQPAVIPVELKFRWFVVTVLIMVIGMSVIQFVMMRWSSWRNEFALWMKLRSIRDEYEDDASLLSGGEFQHGNVPDVYSHRVGDDLESLGTSLGTKVLLGMRDVH